MEVCLNGLKNDAEAFKKAGVKLPEYDVAAVQKYTDEHPVWIHMGAGNIYHGFIASLQQNLLNAGLQKSGILTLSTRSSETRDKILTPHDNLEMSVTLLPDTSVEMEIIASSTHDYLFNGLYPDEEVKVRNFFHDRGLQMLSFTITEKGYALRDIEGNYLSLVAEDLKNGPAHPKHGMSIVTALLLERYNAGALPLALVSMDNCSHNGDKLKQAVVEIAGAWVENGFVEKSFVDYLNDGSKVSFPCTMIDKITPRPDPVIADKLKTLGIVGMEPIKTSKGTFIAPFVNAEKPQYLVVEDDFPNGRPQLEKVGVLFTTKDGVDLCERMKVTTCLNPLHTALAVYGCILGYERISAEMDDDLLVALVKKLGYDEGLKVVDDPKILNPKDFLTEVITERLTNKCLPDSPQRIATDTSLKVPVRFGETIKNYKKKGLDASKLVALPLAIAGWLRYLLALDDQGKVFELSDDPQIPELKKHLEGVRFGSPESVGDKLKPILSNSTIFGSDLYDAGLAKTVEGLFAELIAGPCAVRATLEKYLKP